MDRAPRIENRFPAWALAALAVILGSVAACGESGSTGPSCGLNQMARGSRCYCNSGFVNVGPSSTILDCVPKADDDEEVIDNSTDDPDDGIDPPPTDGPDSDKEPEAHVGAGSCADPKILEAGAAATSVDLSAMGEFGRIEAGCLDEEPNQYVGGEVVFSFTAPLTGSYDVNLIPDPSLPNLRGLALHTYRPDGCGKATGCILSNNTPVPFATTAITLLQLQMQQGEQRFIVVDGKTENAVSPLFSIQIRTGIVIGPTCEADEDCDEDPACPADADAECDGTWNASTCTCTELPGDCDDGDCTDACEATEAECDGTWNPATCTCEGEQDLCESSEAECDGTWNAATCTCTPEGEIPVLSLAVQCEATNPPRCDRFEFGRDRAAQGLLIDLDWYCADCGVELSKKGTLMLAAQNGYWVLPDYIDRANIANDGFRNVLFIEPVNNRPPLSLNDWELGGIIAIPQGRTASGAWAINRDKTDRTGQGDRKIRGLVGGERAYPAGMDRATGMALEGSTGMPLLAGATAQGAQEAYVWSESGAQGRWVRLRFPAERIGSRRIAGITWGDLGARPTVMLLLAPTGDAPERALLTLPAAGIRTIAAGATELDLDADAEYTLDAPADGIGYNEYDRRVWGVMNPTGSSSGPWVVRFSCLPGDAGCR